MEKNYKIAGMVIAAFIFGGIVTKNIPASNNSNAENNVTINQQIPENSGKFLKIPEKVGKKRKIVNINKDDFATLKNELEGIGRKKVNEIISRREKQPFTSIYQLLEEGIVGVESFEKNRNYMVVGD